MSPDERDQLHDVLAAWAVVGLSAVGVLVWGYAFPEVVGFHELWNP